MIVHFLCGLAAEGLGLAINEHVVDDLVFGRVEDAGHPLHKTVPESWHSTNSMSLGVLSLVTEV